MSAIDIDSLTSELSPESISGENLEYDPAFQEMELASQGKPEQQMGDSVVPAEEPNWRDLRDKSLAVLARSHDLRAGVQLSRALLQTDGMPGLRDGLRLIHVLLDQRWATVHPELDADDDDDPTMRLNALAALGGQETTVNVLREAPLVSSRALGRFSLRDVLVASGQMDGSEREGADLVTIDAAFIDCDLDELQATADAVNESADTLREVEGLLAERVGAGMVPDFEAVNESLRQARQILAERLSRRGVVVTGGEEADAGGEAQAAPQAIAGEINSREDVARMLDKICDYFARHEPSSPVPLLLQRAKRLSAKNFMEIMRDMAPEGLSQAELITGVDSSDE